MKIDASVWMLATFGASLLVGAGALLRAAFAGGRVNGASPSSNPNEAGGDPHHHITRLQAELTAFREEALTANAAREAQRIEMVEQRQRAERQVQGAQAEIQRLSAELDAAKSRAQTLEQMVKDLKGKLASSEDELKKPRPPGPEPKTLTGLSGDTGDLQKKLKAANEERDAARAKIEALERLVEGVRARSRELAEELKSLKKE
ncbi:MAG TPA: hypothetical protein VF881_04825 [Polyangiaceae bacterium]